MPYILDQSATRDLENWMLQVDLELIKWEDGSYRYPCVQLPSSVWKACDGRTVQDVRLVVTDEELEDCFVEVIAPGPELLDSVGAEIWLTPYFEEETLEKLLVSLENTSINDYTRREDTY